MHSTSGYQAAEHFSRAPNWRSEALWFLLEQTEPSDSHGEVYPESSISLVSRPRNISGRWKQGHIPGRLVNCLRSRRNGKGKAVVFWIIRNRHAISSVWSAWNTIQRNLAGCYRFALLVGCVPALPQTKPTRCAETGSINHQFAGTDVAVQPLWEAFGFCAAYSPLLFWH